MKCSNTASTRSSVISLLLTVALALGALAAAPGRVLPQEVAVIESPGGDINGDGSLDIGDAVFLLIHLFAGGPPPAPVVVEVPVQPCEETTPAPSEETGIYIVEGLQLSYDVFEEQLDRLEVTPRAFNREAVLTSLRDVQALKEMYDIFAGRVAKRGDIEDWKTHVVGHQIWAEEIDGLLAILGHAVQTDRVLAYEIANARNSMIALASSADVLLEGGDAAKKGCKGIAGTCPRPCAVSCTVQYAQECLDAGCHFEVRDNDGGGCKVVCVP